MTLIGAMFWTTVILGVPAQLLPPKGTPVSERAVMLFGIAVFSILFWGWIAGMAALFA